MENMEDKLSSILANPQMMSQIMSMAQALGQSQQPSQETSAPPQKEPQSHANSGSQSGFDADMLRRIVSATKQTGVDKNQQGLLKALGPYLSRGRISKLEKAMRAARIAGFAAAALNGKGR